MTDGIKLIYHTMPILQADESLYLLGNKYTVLSTIQMRETQIQFNDIAKQYCGLQDLIADNYEVPLTLEPVILYLLVC